MNIKSALLAGTAAIAICTSAQARPGDAYVSIFGGWSTLGGDSDFSHYAQTSASTGRVNEFLPRILLSAEKTGVQTTVKKYGKTKTTGGGFTTVTATFTTTNSIVFAQNWQGGITTNQFLTYRRQFSGELEGSGFVVGASLGVEFFAGLRGELEAAYRRFDLQDAGQLDFAYYSRTNLRYDEVRRYQFPISLGTSQTFTNTKIPTTVTSLTTTKTSLVTSKFLNTRYTNYFKTTAVAAQTDGEISTFSFMFNLWYDLPLGDTGLTPFVGGGIGVANVTMDYRMRVQPIVFADARYNYRFTSTSKVTNTSLSSTTTKTYTNTYTKHLRDFTKTFETEFKDDIAVFAYQFGAGLGYEFDNGLRLSAQYRYFATADADFGPVEANVQSHDFLIGLTLPLGRQRISD